jgi:thiamine biosynthesis protein ThiS
VKIRLNGEPAEVPDGVTIGQLLERLGIDPRRVAVEHNLTIIKRHRQAGTVVSEGDEVEIVNFVGGG